VDVIIDREFYIIYYGVIDPKELVSQIIIDDGFIERGKAVYSLEHRNVLFHKKLNYIGIGIHEHPTHYFVVVIAMANHIRDVK
jgi:hypothetical protein